MNPIHAAALELEAFCRQHAWRFCFIGGLAVGRWGEPRLTLDADLTLLTGFGGEAAYVDALLARFDARLPDARPFALDTRVLLLRAANGVPLDIALGAMPFEARAVDRASDYRLDEQHTLRLCSAEDLVVFKVFAGRPQDWHDVETVLMRQAGRLNLALVREELRPLVALLEEPGRLDQFERLLARLGLMPDPAPPDAGRAA